MKCAAWHFSRYFMNECLLSRVEDAFHSLNEVMRSHWLHGCDRMSEPPSSMPKNILAIEIG